MPQEETVVPEIHEIEVPKAIAGKVRVFTPAGFSNPAPRGLIVVVNIIRIFCLSLIGLVAGTTIFTGNQSKNIIFVITVISALCEAIKTGVGVESNADAAKRKESNNGE